jgi:chemotaxis protein MotB
MNDKSNTLQSLPSPAVTIIRKVKKVHKGGHHGGAWKVAYADFVTAMMAFFLLMWILQVASPTQRAGIAAYFTASGAIQGPGGASRSVIDLGGSEITPPLKEPELGGIGSGESHDPHPDTQDADTAQPFVTCAVEATSQEALQDAAESLSRRLHTLLKEHPGLEAYRNNLVIDATLLGPRVQLIDDETRPLFERGSALPLAVMDQLLKLVGAAINDWPNRISIAGHTDAHPYRGTTREEVLSYTNWELSADRAHAARRSILQAGVTPGRVARVEGFGSSIPFDKTDPMASVNRRISILFLSDDGERILGLAQNAQ